jgi:uncharacterized protein with HEPN domain
MPYRDWTFRLTDVLDAISAVQKYTITMRFDDFVADRKTVDAVIRNLIIIGEAACHIPDEICQANPDIPWQDMRAMRNFVVHEYFGVSDNVLWDTIQVDLPPLVPFLRALMERYPKDR